MDKASYEVGEYRENSKQKEPEGESFVRKGRRGKYTPPKQSRFRR